MHSLYFRYCDTLCLHNRVPFVIDRHPVEKMMDSIHQRSQTISSIKQGKNTERGRQAILIVMDSTRLGYHKIRVSDFGFWEAPLVRFLPSVKCYALRNKSITYVIESITEVYYSA